MSGQQKEYIDTALNPFLKEIIPEVLQKKPDEPIQFMIDWLRTKLGYPKKMTGKEELSFLRQELARLKQVKNTGSEGELSNSDEDDEVDDLEFTAKTKAEKHRSAVSAEAYGTWNRKGSFTPRFISKTNEQIEKLR